MSALNARWTEAHFDDELDVYLKALVANVAIPSDETKAGRSAAVAPQFELAFSGWYWQITRLDANSAGNPGVEVAVRHPASPSGRGEPGSRRDLERLRHRAWAGTNCG